MMFGEGFVKDLPLSKSALLQHLPLPRKRRGWGINHRKTFPLERGRPNRLPPLSPGESVPGKVRDSGRKLGKVGESGGSLRDKKRYLSPKNTCVMRLAVRKISHIGSYVLI
jgi:hypothetical protein